LNKLSRQVLRMVWFGCSVGFQLDLIVNSGMSPDATNQNRTISRKDRPISCDLNGRWVATDSHS